jgi:phenylpropionate dioxygenase-like ring-hydroxylating dioxygenase large terminal subunit
MSKSYLLVILLLAASFTGCMGGSDDNTETDTTIDDEIEQEENQELKKEDENEEEETIDPVGEPVGDSSTDCVCNCTLIVEDNSYDPEHFSSVWISPQPLGYWNETGVFIENSDGNEFGGGSIFRGFFNKTGNNVQITPLPYTNDSFAPFTTDENGRGNTFWYQITIYGPSASGASAGGGDGLVWQDFVKFLYYDCDYWDEGQQICYSSDSGNNDYYFNIVDIELPWEPVGFSLRYTDDYTQVQYPQLSASGQVIRSF